MFLAGKIRERIKAELSPERVRHVFAVEEEAQALCKVLDCTEYYEDLSYAALLHDITKEKNYQEQLKLCDKYDIILSDEQRLSPKTIHAITAAAVAKNEYGMKSNICSAIRRHTTGHQEMNLFEKIIFIADYIEKTREESACRMAREQFYNEVACVDDIKSRYVALDRVVLLSLSQTIKYLAEKNLYINENTFKARNRLCLMLYPEKNNYQKKD
ncbi:MAG: HD domain-containing protein [Ruminococcaceae bacterium]|nr:HD domain-containing protein [Oscillospiraceae bacterium]